MVPRRRPVLRAGTGSSPPARPDAYGTADNAADAAAGVQRSASTGTSAFPRPRQCAAATIRFQPPDARGSQLIDIDERPDTPGGLRYNPRAPANMSDRWAAVPGVDRALPRRRTLIGHQFASWRNSGPPSSCSAGTDSQRHYRDVFECHEASAQKRFATSPGGSWSPWCTDWRCRRPLSIVLSANRSRNSPLSGYGAEAAGKDITRWYADSNA